MLLEKYRNLLNFSKFDFPESDYARYVKIQNIDVIRSKVRHFSYQTRDIQVQVLSNSVNNKSKSLSKSVAQVLSCQ